MAAWGYAAGSSSPGDTNPRAKFMSRFSGMFPCWMPGGVRPSRSQRGVGDVLIAWENEAFLTLKEQGGSSFEIVVPSLSILAEPTVAVVDRVVKKKKTEAIAKAYLEYLYSEEGQEIIAKNYFRPRLQSVAARYADRFPKVELLTVDRDFGGWSPGTKGRFSEGGSFDRALSSASPK
ncbi:MAG: sulfate ABC transporter substrate-binding protein [Verrucomicrobiota bacterium]